MEPNSIKVMIGMPMIPSNTGPISSVIKFMIKFFFIGENSLKYYKNGQVKKVFVGHESCGQMTISKAKSQEFYTTSL